MSDLLSLGDTDDASATPISPCLVCGAALDEGCEAGPHVCPREAVAASDASAQDPDGPDEPSSDATAAFVDHHGVLPGSAEPDASPVDALRALFGELAQPENTSGVYMVLWAKVPDQGVKAEHRYRPDWQEVGYFTASSRDVARARSIEHDGRSTKPIEERGPVARYLIEQAKTTAAGIMLRAVPAEYWPAACPVTSYTVPAPILTLGS